MTKPQNAHILTGTTLVEHQMTHISVFLC